MSGVLPAYAKVVINEVAWMGTANSATDEWIELYSDSEQNLKGWTLVAEDGGMKINLKGTTTPGGYYLIERTDDNAVPNISADLITPFGKGLSNSGEILILKDASGAEVDKVAGSNNWAIGGDSDSKKTLQRNLSAPKGWITAAATPKAENVKYSPPKPKASPHPAKTAPKAEASLSFDLSLNTDQYSPNGEYLWLLGGILGGAILGISWVIIAKWKGSPS